MVLGALKRAENTKPVNTKPGKSVRTVKKRMTRPNKPKKNTKESDKKTLYQRGLGSNKRTS